MTIEITRRSFLFASGVVGGGLLVGCASKPPVPNTIDGSFQPNSWLQILPDDRVIFQLDRVEMGQGVNATLPVLTAEELDIDPSRIEVQMAGTHPDFGNPILLSNQTTGGSTSVASSWERLRDAGAAARAMLIEAAAERWGVDPGQVSTNNGVLTNNISGETLTYGEASGTAAKFKNAKYSLKAPADYQYIGKSVARPDSMAKATGQTEYSVDVNLPGMLVAVVVRSPYFGGELVSWDKEAVTAQPGVKHAFEIHSGIAIVADGYWPARKAASQLNVEWRNEVLKGVSSETIVAGQRQALDEEKPHYPVKEGDVEEALEQASKRITAEYLQPTLNHSPMEPMCAAALYKDSGGDSIEVWTGTQGPQITQNVVAEYVGLPRKRVVINNVALGGGFGRRSYPDYVAEASVIAKALPNVPIKLIWSREDEVQHDFYRPASLHRFEAGLDENGKVIAHSHNVASQSVSAGFSAELMASNLPTWVPKAVAGGVKRLVGNIVEGRDPGTAEGADYYPFENRRFGQVVYDVGVPVGFWRAVAYSNNVFVYEGFMDELAHAAGKDPLAFRQEHLEENTRQRRVLDLAAEKAGWGNAPDGVSQGIAISRPFGTHCAMVADVTTQGNGFKVEKIVAAVDCGLAINPDNIVAQIKSGVIYGLAAALKPPITVEDGKVQQSNFHDVPVMRMNEVPEIEVYIVKSDGHPTGVGEIGLPNVAPSIANALFKATGQRLRQLPLELA